MQSLKKVSGFFCFNLSADVQKINCMISNREADMHICDMLCVSDSMFVFYFKVVLNHTEQSMMI